jgi:hypothetical protein
MTSKLLVSNAPLITSFRTHQPLARCLLTHPILFLSDNERLIGDAAKNQVDMNFQSTYVSDCRWFENPEYFIEHEPISNISIWDPRRRKRGDSTTPADTILTGRCLVRFLFFPFLLTKQWGLISSYGNETDEDR